MQAQTPSLNCTFLEILTYCEFARLGLRSLGRSAEVTGIPSPTSAYNTELDSRAWRLLEVNPSTVGLVQNYFRFRARYFESHWTTKTKFSKYSLIRRRRRPDKDGRCDEMSFHLGVQSWQDSALWQIDPGKKRVKIKFNFSFKSSRVLFFLTYSDLFSAWWKSAEAVWVYG